MPATEIEISIVMPCLNEAESLPYCLVKAFSFLTASGLKGEVIVVDNGSTDGSDGMAKKHGATVVKESTQGYGAAIMAGAQEAAGKYIIIGDADDSYDFGHLMPFVDLLKQDYDLVVGNRFKGGIKKNSMPFLHKYVGNPVLSLIGRLFFGTPVNDFHCGLRAIKKESYHRLDLKTTGMEFASEMIVKASLHKLRITETPVVLHRDKRSRPSHLNTWQDGWRHLRFLLLYSPKWLFLFPGLLLMLTGIAGTVVLAIGPVEIGNKKLDVHTLVYTAGFVLLGFQFISFYFFSRLYAAVHGLWPGQEKFLQTFTERFTLEKGIVAGGSLVLGGVYLMAKSLLYWRHTHFGNIDPVVVLRWVVPSVALLVLGTQLALSSFYLGFLTIKSKAAS